MLHRELLRDGGKDIGSELAGGDKNFLCTGGSYYVPYSFLLISNKFCNGREWPEQCD